MKDFLINLNDELPEQLIDVYQIVNDSANNLGISYLVIGATARDLVMVHGLGAKITRATTDLDFAIQVQDWNVFESLKLKLIEQQFVASKTIAHRLISQHGWPVDIVPFGEIAGEKDELHWPPGSDIIMSTLGFNEAYSSAWVVKFGDSRDLIVKVASPAGMLLLKLISFVERSQDKKGKDASDILYLIDNYKHVPGITESLYDEGLMEECDFREELALPLKLGKDVNNILTSKLINWLHEHYIEKDYKARLYHLMSKISLEHLSEVEKISESLFKYLLKEQN